VNVKIAHAAELDQKGTPMNDPMTTMTITACQLLAMDHDAYEATLEAVLPRQARYEIRDGKLVGALWSQENTEGVRYYVMTRAQIERAADVGHWQAASFDSTAQAAAVLAE